MRGFGKCFGAVEAGRQAVELATVRHKQGKASYYEVLEAQEQLFRAEDALARIRGRAPACGRSTLQSPGRRLVAQRLRVS